MSKFGTLLAAAAALTPGAPVAARTTPAAPAVSAPAASAPTAAALADARAIVDLTQGEKALDFVLEGLAPLMSQAILGQLISAPDAAPVLEMIDSRYPGGRNAYMAAFGETFRANFRARYSELAAKNAELYARSLSADDLRATRVFYESAAGRALVAVQPDVQAELSKVGAKIGAEVAVSVMNRMVADLEKGGKK